MQHTQNTSKLSQLLISKRALVWIVCILTLLVLSRYALAQDATTPDSGDTAWMLTSTALVLFMTIPGARAVLRWACANEKCAFSADAVFYTDRVGNNYLGRGGL